MSSIVEFLKQRFAEDEAVVRSVLDHGSTHADLDPDNPHSFNAFDPAPAAYLRRFTPGRMLAEIAAKRGIIETLTGSESWLLGSLASVYQDHPDYDSAWHPEYDERIDG